jgi:CO/xanthine dehydrogenase Mo-binding subunit
MRNHENVSAVVSDPMHKYVGKPIPRYDGIAQVTGATAYVDDIRLPGMLTVKVLRAPVHRARLLNVDVSRAERLRGVAGVITAKDVPGAGYGTYGDHPALAKEETRYKGQVIAAVAAVDQEVALDAVDRIALDLEELTPILDPEEAMKPDAPKVRPEGNTWIFDGQPFRKIRLGDVDKAFAESDCIVEGTYTTPMQEQSPMETSCAVASIDRGEQLVIHSLSQSPYGHLRQLSRMLKLPMNRIRLVGGNTGGAFGARFEIHADHVAALLALKTRKPVKWRWTREEETLYSTHRGRWKFYFKDGVKKDGRIIARYIRTLFDTGAYTGTGPYVVEKNATMVTGPYNIPNVWVDGYCVYTNRAPAGAMRGFGVLPGQASEEIQMNRIAEAIGMDPWQIRFVNAWRNGDTTATGKVLDSVAAIECLQAAAKLAGIDLPDRLKAMSSRERRK